MLAPSVLKPASTPMGLHGSTLRDHNSTLHDSALHDSALHNAGLNEPQIRSALHESTLHASGIHASALAPPPHEPAALRTDDDNVSMKSRRSSVSQSSQSSHGSLRKFQHHYEPTVLDRPDAVDAIRDALLTDNADTLAQVVGAYGLPPSLRASAWPLLLRTHPYVKEALAAVPEPLSEAEIPVKRIRGDLKRFRRYRGPALPEEQIFNTIHDFLVQWGSKIGYETAMIWIADFLVSGDTSAENGTPSGSSAAASSVDLSSPISPIASSPVEAAADATLTDLAPADSASTSEDYGASQAFTGIAGDNLTEVFTHLILVMTHAPAEFSNFISAVRYRLPMVSRHFECEGVLNDASGGDDWLVWWLGWLGIRAFAPSTLARLWDCYFAIRDDTALERLHMYNCVLLMKENSTRIMELDQSECRQFLTRLPSCKDVEVIIAEGRALSVAACETAEDESGTVR